MRDFLKKTLKPFLPKYLFIITIGILLNILIIMSTFIAKVLVDKVLPSKNYKFLLMFILFYLSFYLFKSIINYLKEVFFSKYGYELLREIRTEFFSKIIFECDFLSFTNEKQGYIMTLFRDWINSISWFLSNILLNTLCDFILLLIVLLVIAKSNLIIFGTLIITIPLYGILYVIFNSKIRNQRKLMMDQDVLVTQQLKDSLDGIREIRSFNAQNSYIQKYSKIQNEFNESGIRYVKTSALYDCLSNIISFSGKGFILLICSILLFQEKMTLGLLLSISSLSSLVYSPVEKIVNFNRLFQVFKTEYEKLSDFTEKNFLRSPLGKKETFDIPEKKQNIGLLISKVCFSYDNNTILNNINIFFEKGKTYTIVGENGSGKSTLINLIIGLIYPKTGDIYFNGKSIFKDLKDLQDYRKKIGYVAQDVFLSNDTIKNNVIFGRENLINENENYKKSIEICELNASLNPEMLKDNFLTGEKGNKLSGGQKQKVALCRALYGSPEILILDEGTSNTDSESEERIIKKIRKLYPELTLIMVSHRLSTIHMSDIIIYLKNGEIKEMESFEKLYREGTAFYKLFSNQYFEDSLSS